MCHQQRELNNAQQPVEFDNSWKSTFRILSRFVFGLNAPKDSKFGARTRKNKQLHFAGKGLIISSSRGWCEEHLLKAVTKPAHRPLNATVTHRRSEDKSESRVKPAFTRKEHRLFSRPLQA